MIYFKCSQRKMDEKFSEFLVFCEKNVGDTKEVLQLVKKRYNDCNDSFKSSPDLEDLLLITEAKMESDQEHVFVHLRDFLNVLKSKKRDKNSKVKSGTKRPHDESFSDSETHVVPKIAKLQHASFHSDGGSASSRSNSPYVFKDLPAYDSDGYDNASSPAQKDVESESKVDTVPIVSNVTGAADDVRRDGGKTTVEVDRINDAEKYTIEVVREDRNDNDGDDNDDDGSLEMGCMEEDEIEDELLSDVEDADSDSNLRIMSPSPAVKLSQATAGEKSHERGRTEGPMPDTSTLPCIARLVDSLPDQPARTGTSSSGVKVTYVPVSRSEVKGGSVTASSRRYSPVPSTSGTTGRAGVTATNTGIHTRVVGVSKPVVSSEPILIDSDDDLEIVSVTKSPAKINNIGPGPKASIGQKPAAKTPEVDKTKKINAEEIVILSDSDEESKPANQCTKETVPKETQKESTGISKNKEVEKMFSSSDDSDTESAPKKPDFFSMLDDDSSKSENFAGKKGMDNESKLDPGTGDLFTVQSSDVGKKELPEKSGDMRKDELPEIQRKSNSRSREVTSELHKIPKDKTKSYQEAFLKTLSANSDDDDLNAVKKRKEQDASADQNKNFQDAFMAMVSSQKEEDKVKSRSEEREIIPRRIPTTLRKPKPTQFDKPVKKANSYQEAFLKQMSLTESDSDQDLKNQGSKKNSRKNSNNSGPDFQETFVCSIGDNKSKKSGVGRETKKRGKVIYLSDDGSDSPIIVSPDVDVDRILKKKLVVKVDKLTHTKPILIDSDCSQKHVTSESENEPDPPFKTSTDETMLLNKGSDTVTLKDPEKVIDDNLADQSDDHSEAEIQSDDETANSVSSMEVDDGIDEDGDDREKSDSDGSDAEDEVDESIFFKDTVASSLLFEPLNESDVKVRSRSSSPMPSSLKSEAKSEGRDLPSQLCTSNVENNVEEKEVTRKLSSSAKPSTSGCGNKISSRCSSGNCSPSVPEIKERSKSPTRKTDASGCKIKQGFRSVSPNSPVGTSASHRKSRISSNSSESSTSRSRSNTPMSEIKDKTCTDSKFKTKARSRSSSPESDLEEKSRTSSPKHHISLSRHEHKTKHKPDHSVSETKVRGERSQCQDDELRTGNKHTTEHGKEGKEKHKTGSQRQIDRLEKLLGKLRNEIEKVRARELTLDDLDDETSDYMLEDRLQRKFVQVWQKLCQIKGRQTTTGRPIERRFQYEGTRYPEINRKIERFINKKKIFPDFHDIKHLVEKVNSRKKLHLGKTAIESLAREAFTDIGNKLQRRRQEDFQATFGSSITDANLDEEDPAYFDRDLHRKLQENKKSAKNKLDQVIDKYAELQYTRKDEPADDDDDDDGDEEEESEMDEKTGKEPELELDMNMEEDSESDAPSSKCKKKKSKKHDRGHDVDRDDHAGSNSTKYESSSKEKAFKVKDVETTASDSDSDINVENLVLHALGQAKSKIKIPPTFTQGKENLTKAVSNSLNVLDVPATSPERKKQLEKTVTKSTDADDLVVQTKRPEGEKGFKKTVSDSTDVFDVPVTSPDVQVLVDNCTKSKKQLTHQNSSKYDREKDTGKAPSNDPEKVITISCESGPSHRGNRKNQSSRSRSPELEIIESDKSKSIKGQISSLKASDTCSIVSDDTIDVDIVEKVPSPDLEIMDFESFESRNVEFRCPGSKKGQSGKEGSRNVRTINLESGNTESRNVRSRDIGFGIVESRRDKRVTPVETVDIVDEVLNLDVEIMEPSDDAVVNQDEVLDLDKEEWDRDVVNVPSPELEVISTETSETPDTPKQTASTAKQRVERGQGDSAAKQKVSSLHGADLKRKDNQATNRAKTLSTNIARHDSASTLEVGPSAVMSERGLKISLGGSDDRDENAFMIEYYQEPESSVDQPLRKKSSVVSLSDSE